MIILLQQAATENILKIAVEKIGTLFCVRNSYKILAKQFDIRRCYFDFSKFTIQNSSF